ncbi:MAG: hypothetical protein QXP01_03935 [Candidatus Hadarchaeum sp.]
MNKNINASRLNRLLQTGKLDLVKCFDDFSGNLVKLSKMESPIDYLKRVNYSITSYLVKSLNPITNGQRFN